MVKQEECAYTDGEAHGMRQHSSSPYVEKSYQVNEVIVAIIQSPTKSCFI